MTRLRQAVMHRRVEYAASATFTAIASAKLRQTLLKRGVESWVGRTPTNRQQSHCHIMASRFTRFRHFWRGMRRFSDWRRKHMRARCALQTTTIARITHSILRWQQGIRALRACFEANMAYKARGYTHAVYRWRRHASYRKDQRGLRRFAESSDRHRSIAAAVRLWRERVGDAFAARATVFMFQWARGMRLGVVRLKRWAEERRVARILTWRAGIWTGTFLGRRALGTWRKRAQHQRDVEAAVLITASRMQRRKIAPSEISRSVMQHAVLKALGRNASAYRLERVVLKAWAERSRLTAKARQQVRAFRARSTLDGFRSFAGSSRHRRKLYLHASRHAIVNIKRGTFAAWKNLIFPWGCCFLYQWNRSSPRANHPRDSNDAAIMGIQFGDKVEYPGVVMTSPPCSWTSPVGEHPLVTLRRLPMIRRRIRGVLHEWRRLAIQGKRLRYIAGALPPKKNHVHYEPSHNNDYMGVDNLFYSRVENYPPHNCRGVPKGLRGVKCTPSSQFKEDVIVEGEGGIPARRNDHGVDHPVELAMRRSRGLKKGSYLQLHIMKTSSK